MTEKPLQFLLPERPSLAAFKSELKTYMPLEEEAPRTLQRTYYDSFDWRVYTSGGVLEHDQWSDSGRMVWRTLADGQILAALSLDAVPRFAWDLPSSSLRDRLEPVIEMRALFPQARVRSQVQGLRGLNEDGKTVVRVFVEDDRLLLDEGRKSKRLGGRVRVVPVRGYAKALEKTLELLGTRMALQPDGDDPMLSAARAAGLEPGGYSSKLNIQLDPDLRADKATRKILEALLDTLEANEAGTREDLDSEFLHDFRVSVRRTRSALSQIKGVLPQRVLERARADFAWLQDITGPTRDMDVYLLKFDAYRASLPPGIRENLGPLQDFLVAHQKSGQRVLARHLGSPRYRKILKDWRKFLGSPVAERSTLPNATRPVLDLANERIWKMFRRALKEGRAIGPESPAEDLHELRKTCKKLRYLMEFFQSLYPPKQIKRLVKALKTLQENLGDFQDLEVQAESLHRFSEQMVAEGTVPPQTLMAMGILVDGLGKRQLAAREDFASRFAQFSEPENRREFEELFTRSRRAVAA